MRGAAQDRSLPYAVALQGHTLADLERRLSCSPNDGIDRSSCLLRFGEGAKLLEKGLGRTLPVRPGETGHPVGAGVPQGASR